MIVIDWENHSELVPRHTAVALIGIGLIGQAIAKQFTLSCEHRSASFPVQWQTSGNFQQQLIALSDHITDITQANSEIHIIWSAGAAGFSAGREDLQAEQEHFKTCLDIINETDQQLPDNPVHFHLISSAGGMFESQQLVDSRSSPQPLRPYGELKQEQEQALLELSGKLQKSIYRPSTVYGYTPGSRRVGLISALLTNSYKGNTSTIYGRPQTLRDYISVEDIARFFFKRLNTPSPEPGAFFLCTGKPTSISELITLIERIIDKPLLLRYIGSEDNFTNNTFLPAVKPVDLVCEQLESSIRQLNTRIKAHLL